MDDANVAVSPAPFGMVLSVQLLAVNQSPVRGLFFQVAFAPRLLVDVESTDVRKPRRRERARAT